LKPRKGATSPCPPLGLVQEYYEVLRAPRKELVVFENSAHLPFLAKVERSTEEVIRVGVVVP
jgi:hypothetical protein